MLRQDAIRTRAALIEYLQIKVLVRDWHGVSDAANDLRELEAKYPFLREKGLL